MPSHDLVVKLFRFGVVGLLVAAVFMGLNWLFGRRLGKQVAFLLAYPPALAVHFFLNRWWTFNYRNTDTGRQAGEYVVMVGITFLIQWGIFTFLSRRTRWPSWVVAGLANITQAGISFFFLQLWVFAGHGPA